MEKPLGKRTWLRFASPGSLLSRETRWARATASSTKSTPAACAITLRVISSAVGPRPPVVIITSTFPTRSHRNRLIPLSSGMITICSREKPKAVISELINLACPSCITPRTSSVPMIHTAAVSLRINLIFFLKISVLQP